MGKKTDKVLKIVAWILGAIVIGIAIYGSILFFTSNNQQNDIPECSLDSFEIQYVVDSVIGYGGLQQIEECSIIQHTYDIQKISILPNNYITTEKCRNIPFLKISVDNEDEVDCIDIGHEVYGVSVNNRCNKTINLELLCVYLNY